MQTIHVARDRTSLGAFPEEEVREGLRSGRLLPTDLGWREGMSDWMPLGQWPELQERRMGQDPAPPPIPPQPSADESAHAAVSALSADLRSAPPEMGVPWERRGALGWPRAVWETIRDVLTSPSEAFSRMRQTGGLLEPLVFYALLAIPMGLISVLYQTGFEAMAETENRTSVWVGLGAGAVVVGLTPLSLLISAGLQHLVLRLLGAATRPFESTLRAAAYALGSASVFQLVPCCGQPVAAIWGLVALCIGIMRIHNCSTPLAILAIVGPGLLCCSGIIALVAAGFAAAAAGGFPW
jgi:hypothetical protein